MASAKSQVFLQYVTHAVCSFGILVSFYALIVEMEKEYNPSYKPSCDISDTISCTKAFMSRWGKGLGLVGPIFGEEHWLNQRNPIYGIIGYSFLMFLGMFTSPAAVNLYFYSSIMLNVTSVYLACILYFKVQTLCIVCATMYAINFVLLLLSFYRRRMIMRYLRRKRK